MVGCNKIGFIGGGNMAEALVRGLLAGNFRAGDMTVSEPVVARRTFLAERYGVRVTEDNQSVANYGDVVIMAVKPQVAPQVLKEIAPALVPGQRLFSIMAGVTTTAIEASVPEGVRVVRVMPNTPALVLEAATAVCAGKSAAEEDLQLACAIFNLVGVTFTVGEQLMDAVTGLSGSGPAYVLTMIEAMADAGVKTGLPRDVAAGLAVRTVLGTARLVIESGEHPAVLREKVTSPGGTTIAGLHVLEKGGIRGTIMNAVEAAALRSKELGGG